jgi:hypothetical protein
LPEEETISVIKSLRVDAIIGLNLMEKHGIYIESDEIRFKEIPPFSAIM